MNDKIEEAQLPGCLFAGIRRGWRDDRSLWTTPPPLDLALVPFCRDFIHRFSPALSALSLPANFPSEWQTRRSRCKPSRRNTKSSKPVRPQLRPGGAGSQCTRAPPSTKIKTTNANMSWAELDGLVDARQKLESQQQENKSVQTEFNSLDDDANIFKLIGPALMKQDKTEALMAVNGRLEFIEKEMYVAFP